MPSFPELSRLPNLSGFSEAKAVDPVIRSDFENGYQLARSKFTSVPRIWTFQYNFLTDEDKDILTDFEQTTCFGGTVFEWTNPSNDRTYEVRFAEPLRYINEAIEGYWSVLVNLYEARPDSDITS